jgi:8-oxo-dGTP diphosphatase
MHRGRRGGGGADPPAGRALSADLAPAGKVYAGYWEFPGGKLEAGERSSRRWRRELHEELGITIGPVQRWREQMVDYPHALVRLHFCKVHAVAGELQMREGQAWRGSGCR